MARKSIMHTNHRPPYISSVLGLVALLGSATCLISPGLCGEQVSGEIETGKASWIGKSYHGKVTANGELHDFEDLVAAHYMLPFGTYVQVTNLENGKSVAVRINDRKASSKTNIIVVSWEAARRLGMLEKGVVKAKVKVVSGKYGIASWYGVPFHGRLTANGEIYDMSKLTAAHKHLPFNTLVRVTNLKNSKSVIVRINDRGPYVKGRIIDLSKEAARWIDMIYSGISEVRLEILPPRS